MAGNECGSGSLRVHENDRILRKDSCKMKEQLKSALASIAAGDFRAIENVAEQIKCLPRRADGLFDTSALDEQVFAAAGLVYPVYAAYETECNKKEGYPDLIVQMRTLNECFDGTDCFFTTAYYLDALIHTTLNVSPQLYEYYSELVDMFKARVNETIAKYYANGNFGANAVGDQQDIEAGEQMIRDAIRLAGENFVLLAEKYVVYM